MDDAKKYRKRVDAILAPYVKKDKIVVLWRTLPEAREAIARIKQMQAEIKLIKKELQLHTKNIRANYAAASAQVSNRWWNIWRGGTRAAAYIKRSERAKLSRAKSDLVVPYDDVIRYIDYMLVKLDEVKLHIQSEIGTGR